MREPMWLGRASRAGCISPISLPTSENGGWSNISVPSGSVISYFELGRITMASRSPYQPMSQPVKLLRGSMILTTGQVLSYGLSFGRNIILARMLTKADFGLAAMFALTISLLEVAGRMAFGQQIVQAKSGGSETFQATSHSFQFVLATAGAVLIVIVSYPMALAFKVPSDAWAFALLAVVPLARGLEHLDYYRVQREFNYLPSVLRDVVPQALVTLAAWPLTLWLRDFRVILWLMIGRAVLGILMTHLLATKPFRWGWDREYAKGMWAFGWPLLITGLLMFAGQQADQMVVGSFLLLDQLAHYALAFSLVSIPWFIFGQVSSSLMLPILSQTQDDPELFRQQYHNCLEYAAVAAVILILPLIVSGEQIVALIYGSKYVGTGILMALLGAASAARFLRIVPSVAATARADTMNQLYSNLGRGISLPLAVAVALLGGGAALIAGCALVAELIAGVISLVRLRERQGVPLRDTAAAAVYVLGFVGLGVTLVLFGASRWDDWLAAGALLAALGLSVAVGWVLFPGVALTLRHAIGRKGVFGPHQPAPDAGL